VADTLTVLAEMARELSGFKRSRDVLEHVVTRAGTLLGTNRVSLRVLDPTGTRLVTTYRAGQSLHWYGEEQFQVGQGLVGWVAGERQALRTGDAEADARFEPRPGMKERLGSFLGVPLFIGERVIGVLSSTDGAANFFSEEHERLLTVLAAVCAPYVEVARLNRLAHVDPLTGVLNRRGLDDEVSRAFEGELRPCVVLIDADKFKAVNDGWGHAAGDEVLRRIAEVLGGVVRVDDAVVRLGGEEFLLVLQGIDLTQAFRVAERARVELAGTDIPVSGGSLRVTASFGVAQRRPGEPRDSVVARADEALLSAKRSGRNRVEVEPPSATS
jgi:diguanylate cyclase (GGDEF)-like protein